MTQRAKMKVLELNSALVWKQIVVFEENLRRLFFDARQKQYKDNDEREIEHYFRMNGVKIKLAIPSGWDREVYDLVEGKPAARVCIYLQYQMRKSGRWKKEELLINNQGGTGVLCNLPFETQEQLDAFILSASESAYELAIKSFENWKTMKPMFSQYVDYEPVFSLVLWLHNNEQKLIWVKRYGDLQKFLGIDEGTVRSVRVKDKEKLALTDTVQECNQLFVQVFQEAELGKPQLLKDMIRKECEVENHSNEFKKMITA